MLEDIRFILFIVGIVLYAGVGLFWACAYDLEAPPGDDNLFAVGTFWPVVILWMLIWGLFGTINKWYRWATKR